MRCAGHAFWAHNDLRDALRHRSYNEHEGVAMSALIRRRGGLISIAAALLIAAAGVFGTAVAAESDAKAVDDLARQAQMAMSKGKPEEAIPLLRKAINMAPDRSDLYMMRSRARDGSGKFEDALEDASKYIELEPKDAYGYLNRARIYLSLDKPDSALTDANKAIELEPNEPDGYYRRADVYTDLGKDAEAKADEAKADELDKKSR
jgi:tetratricopeptide (TPR) repeat protein